MAWITVELSAVALIRRKRDLYVPPEQVRVIKTNKGEFEITTGSPADTKIRRFSRSGYTGPVELHVAEYQPESRVDDLVDDLTYGGQDSPPAPVR